MKSSADLSQDPITHMGPGTERTLGTRLKMFLLPRYICTSLNRLPFEVVFSDAQSQLGSVSIINLYFLCLHSRRRKSKWDLFSYFLGLYVSYRCSLNPHRQYCFRCPLQVITGYQSFKFYSTKSNSTKSNSCT